MTKLNTILERETDVTDADGRPLIVGLFPNGNSIALRPKRAGAKGDVRTITIADLWRTLGKAGSVPLPVRSQNGGTTRTEVLRDLRAKLQTLPRRDVDYKRGIELVGQALDALEELERYLSGEGGAE